MDFMKVFDQTVREIKREVNLKVLKVPEIEQKVLDATDNEPWGPHGSALAEIAQATKKFTECQMVMSVLWTRLGETGKDWRYVYKALAVIEYLVAHGSERAVDDIVEHTFQISALSSFEYVEPSGKDVGLNVRKKAENIVALLNNREKIQEVRNKAAANRDKYFGLSSTGITYKSGSASFSTGSYQSHSSDKYGGFGSNDSDRYRDGYGDKAYHEEEKIEKYYPGKSRHGSSSDRQESSFKKGTHSVRQKKHSVPSRVSKSSTDVTSNDMYSSAHSQSSSVAVNNDDDDFDDFDPRGTSTAKVSAGNSNHVDLFGQDLIGDLMDAPTSVPTEKPVASSVSEVDLFADAAFVSAEPHVDQGVGSQSRNEVDLFASQPAIPSSATATVDLLSVSEPVLQPDSKSESSGLKNNSSIDPFTAVPLGSFDGSDLFGEFTSPSDSASEQPSKVPGTDGIQDKMNVNPLPESRIPPKKDAFQVKSGIWADSLSRGLIDLNISARKFIILTSSAGF
ncbi:clathrin interactor EPSIN 1 [Neltuma alba]|uniref:clathrin interactor EPSIN 1 n=1 Tax=Neltuma alba TaxID=207710 RepID=UPI0010A4B685|nr:clathrin interactor EPSIN 1-like [Prosopis alba]